ncbi:MAG: sulfotransferase [Bacteroidota bacterium]
MLIKKAKRSFQMITRESSSHKVWPCPNVDIETEPHFIFILTPPYSGSTALAQTLNSCHHSMLLQKRGEGQWLIPGMCSNDRWNPDKYINWDSVRAVWLQRIKETNTLVQNINFIIEKSPPNLVRLDQLTSVFPKHTLIAFNRDPFANCSSRLFRHHKPGTMGQDERLKRIKKIASKWIFCSWWVRKWMAELPVISFTYESFCASPEDCISQLVKKVPEFQTVDVNKKIKVKDYQKQTIINQNERQISKLTPADIDVISEVLEAESDLVKFFGYSTRKLV